MHGVPVYRIAHLVVENYHAVQHGRVRNSEHAARILRGVLQDADREQVVALMLDAENWLVGIDYLATDPFGSCVKHPRQVFIGPILANARTIILGHNHISGDAKPSPEDGAVTRRLRDAGKLLGIDVRDHIIVGEDLRFYSLLEAGLLDDRTP